MIAVLAAAALGGSVALLTMPARPTPLAELVSLHIDMDTETEKPQRPVVSIVGRAAGAGTAVGLILPLAAGLGFRPVAAVVIGGVAAWSTSARTRARSDKVAARMTAEVPTIADALALHLLAGDPIVDAVVRVTKLTDGIIARDLTEALEGEDGFETALRHLAACAPSPHGARLYSAIAQAHRSGGRLAETLTDLATDVRAAIGRDLTIEGGRRALATYGPILALMVPTTLLFLMYPTVVGLTSLSGS